MQRKIIIILGVALGLFFSIGGYFISTSHHNWVKSCPYVYVFDTLMGPPNPALVIFDLKDKEKLIFNNNAYQKDPHGEAGIDFKFTTVGPEQVYLLGYTEDSVLAEIVTYTYDGNRYLRCWVDARAIQNHAPIRRERIK